MHVCMLSHFCRVWLCDPVYCGLPGSSVHGILQARILEWVAMPSSRGSSRPRDWPCVSLVNLHGQVDSLPSAPPGKTFPPIIQLYIYVFVIMVCMYPNFYVTWKTFSRFLHSLHSMPAECFIQRTKNFSVRYLLLLSFYCLDVAMKILMFMISFNILDYFLKLWFLQNTKYGLYLFFTVASPVLSSMSGIWCEL